MKTNQAGIDLIKSFEGCKLEAYLCPAGIPTIGYGTTRGVKLGMKITEALAEKFLREDIVEFENQLDSLGLHLNSNQYAACISFIYNLGFGNFRSSTLRAKIANDPDDPAIADQFLRWTKAGGKVLDGLVRRREAEAKLYFTEP